MVLLIRLAFIALVPLGIFSLVKAIKLIQASFFGDVIAKAQLAQQQVNLAIAEEGLYAIWLRGSRSEVSAIDNFQPAIWENTSSASVRLQPTFGHVYASDSDGYRVKLFTFSAPAGSYTLALGEVPKVANVSDALLSLFAGKAIDPATFVVQVRKATPFYYGPLGILLCILSAFLIIGGIICASLADEIVGG